MPLSQRDLEAIRVIVREELARSLRTKGSRSAEDAGDELTPEQLDSIRTRARASAERMKRARDDADVEMPDDDLMRAEIRALLEWTRRKTAANKSRLLVARAHYKIARDESYQGYARKLFRLAPDEPITLEQMIETIKRRQPTMR